MKELLNVTDSRFQAGLLADAKRAGKIAEDYTIPERFRDNLPERYTARLAACRSEGLFPSFPFGTELTDEEVALAAALRRIKAKVGSAPGALEAVLEAAVEGASHADVLPYLERMGLANPKNLRETLYQRLIAAELRHGMHAEPATKT